MVTYGFFNAVDGDRKYNADSFNDFFDGILTDTGVYKNSGDGLVVVPSENMTINISAGKARINKHWINVDSPETLVLADADVSLSRYDAVVLRYSEEDRTITPVIITGTLASSPAVPTILRTASTYDICLAYIYVAPNVTSIDESYIIDTREDANLCGYVKLQITSVNAGIKEYRNTVTTEEEVTSINIGIEEYDADNDLLFANINGVMFVQDVDYSVSGTGSSAKIVLTNSVKANNTIEFRVIKSIIEVL